MKSDKSRRKDRRSGSERGEKSDKGEKGRKSRRGENERDGRDGKSGRKKDSAKTDKTPIGSDWTCDFGSDLNGIYSGCHNKRPSKYTHFLSRFYHYKMSI